MAKTMRAAVVRELGKPLTVEDVPIPVPGAGEILVRIMSTGVCHTDLHAARGDWPSKPTPPFIPGHEGAGVVAAMGAGVRDLKEGDPVGLAWLHDACGSCEYCLTGWETLCAHQRCGGYNVDGTFAEYALGTAAYVARLPARVDFSAMAPILCAGVTTYKGLKETETRPGEWVAISGIGGLGHVAIQYAIAMGMRVVALDVAGEKLALAKSLGAEVTVDARASDVVDRVIEATKGGAHGVLVTAASRGAFAQALHLARRKGTIVFLGLPPGEFPTPIIDIVLKRLTLRGSIVGTRKDLAEAVEFASAGKVHAHIHKAKLEDINRVLTDLEAGNVDGRIVIDFG